MTVEWNSERLGKHHVQIEGDLIRIQWLGELSAEGAREICALFDALLAEHERIFILSDTRHAGGFGVEARKAMFAWPNFHRIGAATAFNASLATRALAQMLRGMFALVGRPLSVKFEFLKTEEEARAYIEARRREIMSQRLPDGG